MDITSKSAISSLHIPFVKFLPRENEGSATLNLQQLRLSANMQSGITNISFFVLPLAWREVEITGRTSSNIWKFFFTRS